MSLIGKLLQGVVAGGGWTAGKAGAEAVIDKLKNKVNENQEKQPEKTEEEVLDEIEVAPDKDDETDDK